jgi:membrane protease subunit (stomatin/prohibitin family)
MSLLLEVLEWCDGGPDEIVHRLPQEGSADIKMGAQLIVQESQSALFFRDGKCLDQLGPGRHVLSTLNLPILTRVLALPYGFRSPFRAAVYFVNRKTFTDLRWGTKNPVVYRDRELGVVRLRGYGRFTLRVHDPMVFLNTIVGPRPAYAASEIEDYLRDVIVSRLTDYLGEHLTSLFDLPALYNEIGAAARARIADDFRRYGCELGEFYIESITPPESVQAMIDERSGLEAVGDLNRFLRYETARALAGREDGSSSAAAGTMSAGVGAGLGLAMAQGVMKNALTCAEPAAAATGTAPATTGQDPVCPQCHQKPPAAARFCPSCGLALQVSPNCSQCHAELPVGSRFCPRCGQAAPPAAEGDTPGA